MNNEYDIDISTEYSHNRMGIDQLLSVVGTLNEVELSFLKI